MIKDRGIIKYNAFMLPEHVGSLKAALIDDNKTVKPILDEQAIEEFELMICEAMEFNTSIVVEIFKNGFITKMTGTVHYINHIENKMVIKDNKGSFHHLSFNHLVNLHQA